jgi:NAD-dependent deacetylase
VGGKRRCEPAGGVKQLRERVLRSTSLFVLTGAGSAESGLPTFRGAGGVWRTHRVEDLASPEGFARDPALVWGWYNERRNAHAAAVPSAAHFALAELESRHRDFTLATQNVDSLHLRAGSRNLIELHGQLREARCTGCAARRPLDEPLPLDAIEHECGGRWRPDIVWFGEPLPPQAWQRAIEAAARADVLLVVGTSGMVHPAASIATRFAPQAYVIEINPETTALSEQVDASVRARASDVLPELLTPA